MSRRILVALFFNCLLLVEANPKRQQYVEELDSSDDLTAQRGQDDTTRRRKAIVHEKPYGDPDLSVKLFRETLSRHVDVNDRTSNNDLCRYKRCSPGEVCDIQDGRAQCICRRRCKQKHNPICGTDDEYYDNHCEMHRQACLSGRDIYDARHKDCFYKVSECSGWDMRQYQDMLLQFYQNVLNSVEFRHTEKIDKDLEEEGLIRTKRGEAKKRKRRSIKADKRKGGHKKHHREIMPEKESVSRDIPEDEFDISSTTTAPIHVPSTVHVSIAPSTDSNQIIPPTEMPLGDETVEQDAVELLHAIQSRITLDTDEEEIMTKDQTGEMVKYFFALMDLDSNGKVGSDEMWEITSLQHLDNVLPGPCNLFHVLKYGDENNDRTLDISETFQLFNISVLRLRKDERYIHKPVVYGDPTRIRCGIEGEDKPVWRRYGREIKEKEGARVSGHVLYLNDVTSRNAGNYTCSCADGNSMTQTIDLQIMVSPRVEVHPRNQHPSLRSSATVKCHAEGRPQPAIRWERNGEPLDIKTGRYILMANNTELHFNSVDVEDSAAYSCVAENQAGVGEDVGALYVQENNAHESGVAPESVYFIFHQEGISVINPHSCQETRTIRARDSVPGLLRQDKLCSMGDSETRECVWSDSIVVGFRFIYVAQPHEDRIVVIDKHLQRVVEIISTDVMPVQLYYVESSDQVFVLCWIDEHRTSSSLQVIGSAAVSGSHFAEHIRPVAKSGHHVYDTAVEDVYIPPESPLNPVNKHAYILHKNEQAIQRLDLSTLDYGNRINLSSHNCLPHNLNYLPMGGLLRISCVDAMNTHLVHEIVIDTETDAEISYKEDSGVLKEYFSYDYSFVIKILPHHDMITLHNISQSGDMHEFMIIRTNFQVADVQFSRKKYDPEAMVAYMVAENQGNIMYVDMKKKKVEIIDGSTVPDETWPWKERTRKLAPSGWFSWFLASAGRTGVEILGLNTNQILCRMDQFAHASSLTWSNGEL